MNYTFAVQNNTLIVYVYGELDMMLTEPLKAAIDAILNVRSIRNVTFDFSHVTFIDSSGLGMILSRYKSLAELGGKVNIIEADEQVYKILKLSGFDKIITIEKSYGIAK